MTEQVGVKLVVLRYHPEHGKTKAICMCSECGYVFDVYIWSIAGCGKKCPNCKQFYSLHDMEAFTLPNNCPKCNGVMTWKNPDWICRECSRVHATVDREKQEWMINRAE